MKQLLFFGIAIFFAIQVFSQSQAILSTVNDINRTGAIYSQQIIIENDTTYILSQNGNHFEFYNVDAMRAVELSYNIVVKDFKVFENKIYFCGESSGYGFIAKATISDLFYSNSFSWDNIIESQSINKMQVYRGSNSEINIACIGTESTGESILLHYKENSTFSYNIYRSQNSDEIFDDILLKDNYIVTVGRPDNNYSPNFIVRRYDRNNILPSTQEQFNNGTEWKYINKLISDTIGGHSIAVVGEATDTDNNDLITIASFVDIFSFNITTHYYGSPKYIASYGEYKHVRDIKYSDADNKLLILEEFPHSFLTNPPTLLTTLASSIIVLDISMPIGISYPASIIYSYIDGIDHKFNRIKERSPYVFATTGINPVSSEVEIWEGDRSQLEGNCNIVESIKVKVIPGQHTPLTPTTLIYSNNINWQDNKNDNIQIGINLICN
ncbi:MAG: hypothetical protein ACK5M0_10695 [Bacteroidales bacterium]